MSSLLDYLAARRTGIFVFLLIVIVLAAVGNWVLWMFAWGRYRGAGRTDSKIRFVLADFFVKIINDFRHLLALIIVMMFAVALFAAMCPGIWYHSVDGVKEGVQAVAAALGGLIGSIIGYYFGESAANKSRLSAADQPALPISPG